MFTYEPDGARVAFDPQRTRQQLAGCVLCGGPIAAVGVFRPIDEVMRRAVITLRQHPVRAGSDGGMAYGLCAQHAVDPDTDRVERVILAAAERITVQ